MDTIYSKSNENVKFIKSLNEKKFRQKNKAFYLEGIKVVNEVLDKAIDVEFIAYSKSLLVSSNGGEELLKRIESSNIKVIDFEENIFKYMTDTVNPQGVLVVLNIPSHNLNNELKNVNGNILILDKIQDPGNIGTIIRSCNAFDVDLIICTKDTVDVYSPKTLRSTMGAILNVKILYVENLDFIEELKNNNYCIATTTLDTNNGLDIIDYTKRYAFVMGNEANGVSKQLQNKTDIFLKIPMTDKIDSLNVGVATSIILYEQYKNRDKTL